MRSIVAVLSSPRRRWILGATLSAASAGCFAAVATPEQAVPAVPEEAAPQSVDVGGASGNCALFGPDAAFCDDFERDTAQVQGRWDKLSLEGATLETTEGGAGRSLHAFTDESGGAAYVGKTFFTNLTMRISFDLYVDSVSDDATFVRIHESEVGVFDAETWISFSKADNKLMLRSTYSESTPSYSPGPDPPPIPLPDGELRRWKRVVFEARGYITLEAPLLRASGKASVFIDNVVVEEIW